MRFRFGLETTASPEQVFTAFTDFSDSRLQVWRKTLDPAKYELRESGDDCAVVREGSAGTRIWVLLRYEWEEPGTIRWTLLDSDHCAGGRGEVLVSPRDGGGSRVDVVIDHHHPRGAARRRHPAGPAARRPGRLPAAVVLDPGPAGHLGVLAPHR